MDRTLSIEMDSATVDRLAELFPGIKPADYVRTFIESCMVDSGLALPPSRYGLGEREFLACAKDALTRGVPVVEVIEERRARATRAVADAFGR